MKRYAIVRVDGHCPNRFENILNENVCKMDKNGECYSRCSKSRYGDTKEQLIKKIQQALFKTIFNDNMQKVVAIEEQKRIYKQYRPMAEKVVEFLGVEE